MGRAFNDVWAEAWPELKPMVDKAFAGEPTFIENFSAHHRAQRLPRGGILHVLLQPDPRRGRKVAGMLDTVVETSESVRAQRQLAVVNGELAHRMRNVLTMVTAIAQMSLRYAPSLEEGRAGLSRRLAALGQAQSLLVADVDIDADVPGLVDQALAPHVDLRERIQVSGAPCRLDAKQGLSLSLALNELITNSIKYGALAAEDGTVIIQWSAGDSSFNFSWLESGFFPAPNRSAKDSERGC